MGALLKYLTIMSLVAFSSATLNLLKPKVKVAALIQPSARYRTVKYLAAPQPIAYSHPVSTFSAHVSTYSSSLPIATYAAPVPVAHVSTYRAPVAVYRQHVPATYAVPLITYPETTYVNTYPDLDEHIIEEHYSNYGEDYAKHYKHFK